MRIFFTIFLLYYDSHSASNAVFCLPQKCISQEMPEIQEMYHLASNGTLVKPNLENFCVFYKNDVTKKICLLEENNL